MAYEELFKEQENYIFKQQCVCVELINTHSEVQSTKHSDRVILKATTSVTATRDKITKLNKSDISNVERIINNSIDDLTIFDLDIRSSYSSIITTHGQSLMDDIERNINNNINKKINAIVGLPQNIINGLFDDAVAGITQIKNMIQMMVTNAIDKYFGDSIKKLNNFIKQLQSLVKLLNLPILPKFKFDSKTGKTTKYNFYKRDKGNSSVSRYVQANIPNSSGTMKPNLSVLKSSPDSKIITPQLKFDTNSVKSFLKGMMPKLPSLPSLSSLVPQTPKLPSLPTIGMSSVPSLPTLNFSALASKMGFAVGLTPSSESKKIEEPTPTGNKAEYGKIQVKENKGGFVEISDETPGNVRRINQHPSGSYNAMLNDGSVHTKVTGDRQEITDGDWNITTSKDKVEIVSGNSKIEIRKDLKETILGNNDCSITGTRSIQVTGKVSDDFKEDREEKIGANSISSVTGNRKESTDGSYTEKISGSSNSAISGSLTIKVSGNVNINSSGQTTINSKGPATISSSSVVRIKAPAVKIG